MRPPGIVKLLDELEYFLPVSIRVSYLRSRGSPLFRVLKNDSMTALP